MKEHLETLKKGNYENVLHSQTMLITQTYHLPITDALHLGRRKFAISNNRFHNCCHPDQACLLGLVPLFILSMFPSKPDLILTQSPRVTGHHLSVTGTSRVPLDLDNTVTERLTICMKAVTKADSTST